MDLYIATRSDRGDIVKIGRSGDVRARCAALQTSQAFWVEPAVIFQDKELARPKFTKLSRRGVLKAFRPGNGSPTLSRKPSTSSEPTSTLRLIHP